MIRNNSKSLQQRSEINSAERVEAGRELAEMLNKVLREASSATLSTCSLRWFETAL